jgi:hypothetical protein
MQRFGVELGDVFTSNPHNKKGNRESAEIMTLNDQVLAYNGGSWDSPVVVEKWSQEHRQARDAIINSLSTAASGYWGFKDPRTLLTLPFWQEAARPQFIGTVRHPFRVARSLQKRGNMPLEKALSLWSYYNQRLLQQAQTYMFPIVNFDLPAEDYLSDALSKLISIGLDSGKSTSAAEFFDQGLRNQMADPVDDELLNDEIVSLHQKLIELT